MNTRIDKLFRNKLAEHTVAPSANAWARVEAGLSKKNNGLIWFRWAAVLLIPVLLAGILVLRRSPADTPRQNTALNDESKKGKNQKKTPENPAKAPAESSKSNVKKGSDHQDTPLPVNPPRDEKKKGTHPVTNEEKQNPAVVPGAGTTLAQTEREPSVPASETTANLPAEQKPADVNVVLPLTAVASAEKIKPIVLEYTLGSTEPEIPVEKGITLTVELKEKKGFQKVIDFALDAKNSEGPLATLRQAKHDLFAFNFKKDKHPK